MQKDLADMPGKEMLMITVEYSPGTVEHIRSSSRSEAARRSP
jgi:hypothetical protein